MKKIRIGKDISIEWTILTNGDSLSLEGRDLKLMLVNPLKHETEIPFIVDTNIVAASYKGTEHKYLGNYSLTLWENYGKDGQTAVDACNVFTLVSTTCTEGGTDTEGLDTETVMLSGDIQKIIDAMVIPDAPNDGEIYGRKNKTWTKIVADVQDVPENEPYPHAREKGKWVRSIGMSKDGGEVFNDYTNNTVKGGKAHAEGTRTTALGYASHAEGYKTKASGSYSHVEGISTTASGDSSHAEGNTTTASGDNSHAEGGATQASGDNSHAEGYGTTASGDNSHAEGHGTTASGDNSHSEGRNSHSKGSVSHAEGNNTKATGSYSHAEGNTTIASGANSHAEGNNTTASGDHSHAEGNTTIASGADTHAEGYNTKSLGHHSHSQNYYTEADSYAQTAIGHRNSPEQNPSPTAFNAEKIAFVIGNGTSSSTGNAFKVLFNGKTFADGEYSSSGADYAEMFEWEDGNTTNEDRVGLFVTLENDKIRLAKSTDNYILGVVSGTPTIIGDNPMRWHGMYLNDKWGRPIYEDVEVTYKEMEINNEGNPVEVEKTRIDHTRKLNPLYNAQKMYIPRAERQEWSYIGMMGKLLVKQDGTLVAGSFCKPSNGGIATKADAGYYVMKIIDNEQALILFR